MSTYCDCYGWAPPRPALMSSSFCLGAVTAGGGGCGGVLPHASAAVLEARHHTACLHTARSQPHRCSSEDACWRGGRACGADSGLGSLERLGCWRSGDAAAAGERQEAQALLGRHQRVSLSAGVRALQGRSGGRPRPRRRTHAPGSARACAGGCASRWQPTRASSRTSSRSSSEARREEPMALQRWWGAWRSARSLVAALGLAACSMLLAATRLRASGPQRMGRRGALAILARGALGDSVRRAFEEHKAEWWPNESATPPLADFLTQCKGEQRLFWGRHLLVRTCTLHVRHTRRRSLACSGPSPANLQACAPCSTRRSTCASAGRASPLASRCAPAPARGCRAPQRARRSATPGLCAGEPGPRAQARCCRPACVPCAGQQQAQARQQPRLHKPGPHPATAALTSSRQQQLERRQRHRH